MALYWCYFTALRWNSKKPIKKKEKESFFALYNNVLKEQGSANESNIPSLNTQRTFQKFDSYIPNHQSVLDEFSALNTLFDKFFTLLSYQRIIKMLGWMLARQIFLVLPLGLLIAGAWLNLPTLMAMSILIAVVPSFCSLYIVLVEKLKPGYREACEKADAKKSSYFFKNESSRSHAFIYYSLFGGGFCVAGVLLFLALSETVTLHLGVAIACVVFLGIIALQGLFIDFREKKFIVQYEHFCPTMQWLGQGPLPSNALSISDPYFFPEKQQSLENGGFFSQASTPQASTELLQPASTSYSDSPDNQKNISQDVSETGPPRLLFIKIPH